MQSEYGHQVSFHYSKYRPPLHKLILEKCLVPGVNYAQGLDIGCGTGHSSIALSDYCDNIFGIDPSNAMLERAIKHPKVEYSTYDGKRLPFQEKVFELISFAGSLHYAKSQSMLDEVLRICKNSATILIYDFEIALEEILVRLNIDLSHIKQSAYNHEVDFSGLLNTQLETLTSNKELIRFTISPSNIVHLLLSSIDYYLVLKDTFGIMDLEKILERHIETLALSQLNANIYYKVYRVSKKE